MRTTTRPARRATATKVVASVALLAGAASVAGLGTFGAFSSTTSASQEVAAGTVKLGTLNPTVSTKVAGMVPGDTVERAVTLTREAGSETFGSVKLTTAASGANLLSTDVVNGLKLAVDECATAWVKDGNKLSCASNVTKVLEARPVVGTGIDLAAPLKSVNAEGRTSYLRVTLALPESAGNDFQNLASTVGFTFDATQRAGEYR